MTGVCTVCRCWFSITIRFRRKFLPCCFFLWPSEHLDFFSIRYNLFLFSFSLLTFLAGAPLDTNHIYCCFYTFRRMTHYDNGLFLYYSPFREKCYPKWRLALRKPLDPSCLSLFSLFSVYLAFFMYCVDNCLLMPLFDTSLLMDPNDSPRQVINPWYRGDYYGPDWATIPLQAPAQSTTAWQPTCLNALRLYWRLPRRPLSSSPGAWLLKGPGQEWRPGAEPNWGREVMPLDWSMKLYKSEQVTRTDMSYSW